MREIQKGDKLYCHTNLVMNASKHVEAYAGKYYYSEEDGYFTNESGNKNHSIPAESLDKWFTIIDKKKSYEIYY